MFVLCDVSESGWKWHGWLRASVCELVCCVLSTEVGLRLMSRWMEWVSPSPLPPFLPSFLPSLHPFQLLPCCWVHTSFPAKPDLSEPSSLLSLCLYPANEAQWRKSDFRVDSQPHGSAQPSLLYMLIHPFSPSHPLSFLTPTFRGFWGQKVESLSFGSQRYKPTFLYIHLAIFSPVWWASPPPLLWTPSQLLPQKPSFSF